MTHDIIDKIILSMNEKSTLFCVYLSSTKVKRKHCNRILIEKIFEKISKTTFRVLGEANSIYCLANILQEAAPEKQCQLLSKKKQTYSKHATNAVFVNFSQP